MEKESLARVLAEHPFLAGLEPRHLELLTGCASNVRFEAGEFIFREGDPADKFYIIRHGRVALELHRPEKGPVVIATIDEGDVLGWSWLVEPYVWHFDARALELTRAIALDGKCVREKCEKDHDLGFEMFKRFSQVMQDRLQATRLQLLDLYE